MAELELIFSDVKVALRQMIAEGRKVHSILTDPPYGLMSIIKRFGKNQAAARVEGTDGSFSRLSAGFMGRQWDGTQIENDPELWALAFEVLLPGGYLLAFSSPRTGHRMACAIEDAGFVMHPFIGWAYGTGLAKQKDLASFMAREDLSQVERWEGYAYGGQARKPALEPVYVAQKPFSERNGALNVLKHGVGAVNIDGCRNKRGNHPANLISDGSIANADLFEVYRCRTCGDRGWIVEGYGAEVEQVACPDCSGMSTDPDPFVSNRVFYFAKADAEDRAGSLHPSVKPVLLLRSLVRHITPPGGTVLDLFAGTGTTGVAAAIEGRDCIMIEREADYADDIVRRFQMETGAHRLARLLIEEGDAGDQDQGQQSPGDQAREEQAVPATDEG